MKTAAAAFSSAGITADIRPDVALVQAVTAVLMYSEVCCHSHE
ncbi:hypothetical protein [Rhodococcus sp. ACS1]|nr:hypothetical protein [Rhodococcus sp. ACS1]